MLFFVVTTIVPIFEVLQTFNEAVEKVHRQYDDLRRQEQQLRESEERLRFAQKAELVQMSFVDITHPDDVRADVELAERLFKREMPFYRTQKRYVKKSGDIIWINLTASIILGSDGRPLHGLAMVEDITEIKRTQEEALFRQKLESVGTLAGGIAHDFNNLLGGVLAHSELALAELDAGLACKEELKVIREVAIRGSEIVRQLMIYAGKESEVVERVDLSKIVEEMLALLKVSVSKHAVMYADLAQDLPPTRAGAAQLRQIVMNLVTNASDAIGDRDGVIRVSTRRVTLGGESATTLESLSDGDYVALEVSDTGCGMSRETQDRLFDPFFTTKSAGRGLGLAVVSGIVRSLAGAIRLTSDVGKGSTFRICCRVVKPGSAQPATRCPPLTSWQIHHGRPQS
jgi:signal transduction histidine kinase